MQNLDSIGERIRMEFDARTQARDRTLARARLLTRHSANAIRAIHRSEQALAHENLAEARELAAAMKSDLAVYPGLYYAGYTQDALKEFCEASITCALIENPALNMPPT
jgi:translin